ncbi:MAG TPA: hypothetical protein VH087_02660 [Thermoanaerobaculia bacterium]|nr:hypothetical protein [Thermoanaerobaculia bacterium]
MAHAARNFDSLSELTERFAGGNMKGSMARAHIDWVRDHRGRDEVIDFFEAVPYRMRNVLAASWYSFEDAMKLDRIIMNRFGDSDLRFLEQLGAYSARLNLTGVYRFFQRAGVHEFFRSSARLHAQFQDFGTAEYRELSPCEGQMIHADYPSYSPLYCSSAIGFYRTCIELHGGKDVDVWESHCQCRGEATCTFEMLWG